MTELGKGRHPVGQRFGSSPQFGYLDWCSRTDSGLPGYPQCPHL